MRRPQLPQDCCCRCRIGWGDDRAERDCRRPGHVGYQRTHDDGNGERRQADGDNDQAGDRRPVVPEVTRRGVIRSVEQNRGDEKSERQLRQNSERGGAWHKRQESAAQREKNGIRRANAACERRKECGSEDQTDEDFELFHVSAMAAILSDAVNS